MDRQYPTSLDCMDYSFCFDDNFYAGASNSNKTNDSSTRNSRAGTTTVNSQQHQQRKGTKSTDDVFYADDLDDDLNDFDPSDLKVNRVEQDPDEYRYINDNTSEIDKVKNKLTTLWNTFKYGWTIRKTKTNFDKELPICILGRFYFVDDDTTANLSSSLTTASDLATATNLKTSLNDYYYVMPEQQRKHQATATATSSMADLKLFEQDMYTRLWFTYRKDFPPINGTKYTSDCGWGCMLRSVQMLIAQGFLLHFLGRDWNLLQSSSRQDHFLNREIISWFNDKPGNKCPFGIHRLLDIAEKMGKKVGDWFGPGTVTLLAKDALEQAKEFITILDDKIRIYVAQDCTIYKQDVIDLCTKNIRRQSSLNANGGDTSVPFIPVILLVSVRLGGEDLNEIYVPALKMFLEMESCLGIIGGKPKHSLYFMGYQDDKVIYLDPHVSQDSVNITDNNFDDTSFHCNMPNKTSFSKLDPSLALGFYCKTFEDFENFCVLIKNCTSNNDKLKDIDAIHPIFSICDDYYEATHLNYRLTSLDEESTMQHTSASTKTTNDEQPQHHKTFKHFNTASNSSGNKFFKMNKQKTNLNRLLNSNFSRNRSNTTNSGKELDDFVLL